MDQKGFVAISDASRQVTDGVKPWMAQWGAPQYTVVGDIVLE